ncbi:MAG TPA: class II aldolase/adducin family protein [Xanthobacteraceae bacterium]|jgi:ribulose-5-phosphate 4-epimerase/fuculose-1-phosphate aldolase|nr:class II aldolase/adducin family protein [Xanthobacteraceae bacterium]
MSGENTKVSESTLRQQVVDCTRMMVLAELLDYSGHVSARIAPDRFLIPRRDASRAGITADDVLVVDLDCKVLEGNGPCPTETHIHAGVYRARPDVSVVGHGHPPMSTLFTMVDRPMIAVRNFGYRFIATPVHPDPTHIRTREQGDAVAHTLGQCNCCLLRGHGSVVAANSVQRVFLDSLEMEENARSVVHATSLAASLGPLKPITAEEADLIKASYAKNDYRAEKIWEHYQEKTRLAGLL